MMPRNAKTTFGWLAAFCSALAVSQVYGDISIENARATLAITENAQWQSVLDKATGRELAPASDSLPIAEIRHTGQRWIAAKATLDSNVLTVSFANTDTVLTYAIESDENWILFRLTSIAGTRPESMTLLQLPVAITENVGRRLNAAWDEQTAVCMMAATRQANCSARSGRHATLAATTQDAPGPQLEGAAVVILICPTPDLKAVAREASHAFGLLTNENQDGIPVKDTDLVRGSYWFLSFGEADVDQVIDYCKRSGIRQVMISSGAWCTSPGHYLFNKGRYPNGQEGLKSVVTKLHEHGILVGMHTFASKISKRDPYVTPVPDKRFLRGVSASWRPTDGLLIAKLQDSITPEQTDIRVAGNLQFWPGSSAVANRYWEGGLAKHLEVTIGDEIIQYERIGPEGVWNTFEGCRRGAWGTAAAAHKAEAEAYHVAVDGCINGYIIDQETDLIDEVAERLAGIFNDCGFDMVYFDGGEDVDRRRHSHYVANFQEQAMKRFTRRPLLHMGTAMNHLVWHSFARSSTVDHYLNTLGGAIIGGKPPTTWPTVQEHIDRSVRYMLSVRQDMMPGELGWFGIWPQGTRTYTVALSESDTQHYRQLGCHEGPVELPSCDNTIMSGELVSPTELNIRVKYDGLQLDELEYLMCKSLGYDVPISLQTGFSQLEAHVLTPEILKIVREYESMRIGRKVPAETLARLKEPGKDFARVRVDGSDTWAEMSRVESPAGTRELQALVGAWGKGSVATIWHTGQDGQLAVDIPCKSLRIVDFMGNALPGHADGERALIPVNFARTTVLSPALAPEQLVEALQQAELRLREPAQVWLRATDAEQLVGNMSFGSDLGIRESGALGDVLVVTGRPSVKAIQNWYAEYTLDIPHDGMWAVWARVRYPRGGDQSFGFVVPGDEVSLTPGDGQVLGNCGVGSDRWHWTGAGGGSTSAPPGNPVVRRLAAGPFTFRIYAREGPGTAEFNPRLDLICLTEDARHVPTDDEAKAWLAEQ